MSRIAIATDSNSGITQAQGKELGVFVLPMPFYINDELFLEDITLSQEQFYQRLAEDADVKTTQPAPGDVIELWEKILRTTTRWCISPCPAASAPPARRPRCWRRTMRARCSW